MSQPVRPPNFGPAVTINFAASVRARKDVFDNVFAGGLPYSRKLEGHRSCVNALCFSSKEGRWLASAGDDLHVQLWDFHESDVNKPSFLFVGHRANIMTLAFSASNRYLYSGGADSMILKHDMTSIPSLSRHQHSQRDQSELYRLHTDIVRGIASHPYHDEIFMSASDDGRILMHDSREENRMTRAQSTIQNNCEFTDIQYHPLDGNLFATSDGRGRVCLRDIRMAFGPQVKRTKEGIVCAYETKLTKKTVGYSNPESSSITFDHQGSRLAVTMLHYLPTIYSISDQHPIATCSGRYLPDGTPVSHGERTYSNSCTMKRGCFGGFSLGTDNYYASGSEDFRGYVWKLPDTASLLNRRREFSAGAWITEDLPHEIGYCEGRGSPVYLPVDLSTPLFHLKGHKSIVNNVLIHPHYPHILTSGVERHIMLHGPAESSPCTSNLLPTDKDVRDLPRGSEGDHERLVRAMTGSHPITDEDDDQSGDEFDTIPLFDQILRQEGDGDVFLLRRCHLDSDSDSGSSVDSDSDGDIDMGEV